jgi:hypothetical protein
MAIDDPCHDDPMGNYGHLIRTLAFHEAVKIVKHQIAARGDKLHEWSRKEIHIEADAYFDDNRAFLMCDTLLKVRREPSLLKLAEAEAKRRTRQRPKPMDPAKALKLLEKMRKR